MGDTFGFEAWDIKHSIKFTLQSAKHMIRNSLCFLVTLFAISCRTAVPEEGSTIQIVAPAEVGLRGDSLDRIREHIQWAIDSQFIAGGVALVAREGKIAWYEAVGYRDRKKTDSLQKDDIFRIASMTKPVTTTAIMQLYEHGKLDVNDPVSKYIPEFSSSVVLDTFNEDDSTYTIRPASRELTIKDLLTHTSGLSYGEGLVAGAIYSRFNITLGWTKDPVLLEDNAKAIAKLPLLHNPGERWTYGTSIDVLGRVVEVVSGMPLDAYFEEHIINPLGMEDTYFYLPGEKSDRLVDIWYTAGTDTSQYVAVEDYPISGAKTYLAGGAGLNSTVLDYFKFANALMNGGRSGEQRILNEETVDLMTANHIDTLHLGEGLQFGYGFSVYTEDGPNGIKAGRYSWGGYWQTIFWVDPSRQIVAMLFTNARETPKWDQLFGEFERIVNSSVIAGGDDLP